MLYEMRGEPEYRKRMQQIISFKGLEYGKITPTDIDALIEYHNRCYVMIEAKHNDKEVPLGQDLAIRRIADNLESKWKPCAYIVCQHNISDWTQDVIVKDCIVRTVYFRKRRYVMLEQHITVKEMCDRFINKYG